MEKVPITKITIWNEGRHEKLHPNVARIYPAGIHGAIAEGLKNEGFAIRIGNLDDPDQGLGEHLLDDTDVLLWFAIRWAKQPHTDGRILSNWHREIPIHR
jgi:trehalose utilization protein